MSYGRASYEGIDLWIDEFIKNIEIYLTKSSMKELIKNDKGCKAFNYLIEQIRQIILSLFNDPGQQILLLDKIKNWHDNYPQNNNWYKYKIFIDIRINYIIKRKHCNSIFADVSARKNVLIQKKAMLQINLPSTDITDISCSADIVYSTFPSFACTPISKPVSQTIALTESDNHVGTVESGDGLRTQSLYTSRDLSDFRQKPLTVTEESEPSSDSSSNTIGLVSLPIFGVLALSFVLYRYTPLVSKFHASFRNNEDISINKDYKATNEMLSNISNSNDMYSESMQHYVSYHTL
ncbi:PIR Superfamily Protein [Plasmodium ovale curtisi]|uniref:PIR Superfamily Protein n=1 Tax=Plasmodium ovale curtisi TaxID=864141 RepID=A0A1A8W830_PLAOA|nr:PIR Superfamily Protein [Plasmodium ovale curtisi]